MSSKFVKFKTRKSRSEPFYTHFLTFSTLERHPFFANDQFCQILAESIVRAKGKHNFAVLAYVFMPDHIHLVVFPLDEAYDMGIILKAVKLGATKCAQHLG